MVIIMSIILLIVSIYVLKAAIEMTRGLGFSAITVVSITLCLIGIVGAISLIIIEGRQLLCI